MTEELTITERIKQLEKEISSAETKVQLYQDRLDELKKEILENEKQCKADLNMPIKNLPDFIRTNEAKIARALTDLEAERDNILEGHEE
jgi:septal ring factor EnvC (AmiA/AmiB activator)